jgi:isopentenyl-diphosphate Delta-isomerase
MVGPLEQETMKDLHLRICLERDVEARGTTGLEGVVLDPGIPDFSAAEMDLTCSFVGKTLSLPLFISPITGGGRQSVRINRALAEAAETCRIGMALGSQRPMFEKGADRESYMVRGTAPTIPLLANLGLMHVKRGKEYLLEAVESVEADGIVIYINPLHEILQKEGDTDFKDCLDILGDIAETFPYPVFIKEVGFGLGRRAVEWASKNRIAGVDVAGAGGTNWARIEGFIQGKDYSVFENLGLRTRDALSFGRTLVREDQYLIASGGVRTGVDMARCFALGAHLVSMALPFLRWAAESAAEVVRSVEKLRDELRTCLWYCGCRTPGEMRGRFVVVN